MNRHTMNRKRHRRKKSFVYCHIRARESADTYNLCKAESYFNTARRKAVRYPYSEQAVRDGVICPKCVKLDRSLPYPTLMKSLPWWDIETGLVPHFL